MSQLQEDHQDQIELSPYELFMIYVDILQHLERETNRYAAQRNFKVTKAEMKKFWGVFLLRGNHCLIQQDMYMYWYQDDDLRVSLVSSAMTRNKFKETRTICTW